MLDREQEVGDFLRQFGKTGESRKVVLPIEQVSYRPEKDAAISHGHSFDEAYAALYGSHLMVPRDGIDLVHLDAKGVLVVALDEKDVLGYLAALHLWELSSTGHPYLKHVASPEKLVDILVSPLALCPHRHLITSVGNQVYGGSVYTTDKEYSTWSIHLPRRK